MGSSRINTVRQKLAEIPKRNFKGFLSDDIHTTDLGYPDPDFAVKEHESGQSYNQRIKDKRKIKPKKPLIREKKYKKVKGDEYGGETMKDVMKGIPGSRVVGTAGVEALKNTSAEKASEVAFKSRRPADIKGYSKSYKKRELEKAYEKYGEGSAEVKKVYDKLYKTDPFKDPKKAHPALIEEGGYPEGGFAEPLTRSTIVDKTMSEINRLAERGDIDEAKNIALQYIPNARNMSEEQLDELLEHIVDTDITDWGDEGIMSVSRKNAERFSKLKSARIDAVRQRLSNVDINIHYDDIMKESARRRNDEYDPKTRIYKDKGHNITATESGKHCGGTSCALRKMFPKSKLTEVRGDVKYEGRHEDHMWSINEKGTIIDASRDQFGDTKGVHIIKPNDKRYHTYTQSSPEPFYDTFGSSPIKKELAKQHIKRQRRRTNKNVSKLLEEKVSLSDSWFQKSARIQMARERLAIVRKPSPNAFKLPEYTELDYEAWHDKVHDTEWRLEDAYESGIFPKDHDWDSLDYELVNKPWKERSKFERQKLRPHYQKMMSGELYWQANNPADLNRGNKTYIKPGFSANITTDARVPTDPDAYYEVHPKDIADKETNVSQMDLDDPTQYAKLRQKIAGLGFRERILNWLREQPRFKSFDPDSSFVGSVKYDQDNQSMQITLNGKKYDFCNVEERLFDSFSGAGSKGAFFNREIKSLHNCGAW